MNETYEVEVKELSVSLIKENLTAYTNKDGSYTVSTDLLHSLIAVAICEGVSIGIREGAACLSRSFTAR